MQTYYHPSDAYYPFYREIPMYPDNDQRFFPFLLPLLAGGIAGGIAGAAISPWLFNRPFYQPYPYPYPLPVPYPTPYPTPYPINPGYAGNPALQQPYSAPVPIADNTNLYNQ